MAARSGFGRDRDRPGSGLGKVSRDAPGLSGRKRMVSLGKLAVPKPLQLPSQKKENAGNDPTTQLVAPGTAGWAKGEGSEHDAGSSLVDKATWASSGGSGGKTSAGDDEVALPRPVTRPLPWEQPVARPLNPSEFPSLEAAKHGKPAHATSHLAADATGSWEEDERRPGMGPQRDWDEHGRGGFSRRPPPRSYGAHQEPQDWRYSQSDHGNLPPPHYYVHGREESRSAYGGPQPLCGRYGEREPSYGHQESALSHEHEWGGPPSSSGRYSSSGGDSYGDGPPPRFSRYNGMGDRGLQSRHNWHHDDELAPRSRNRERHDSYELPQRGGWSSAKRLSDVGNADLFPPLPPELPQSALESAPRDDERDAFNAEVERLAAEMAAGQGRLAETAAAVPEPSPVPRTAWQQPAVDPTAVERPMPPLRPEQPPRWEEPAAARPGPPEHEAGHRSEPVGYQQGKAAPALFQRGPPMDAAQPPGSSLRSNGVHGRLGLPMGPRWHGLPRGRHGSGDFRRDVGPPPPVEPRPEPPPVVIVRRQQPPSQTFEDSEPRSGAAGAALLPPPSEPPRALSAQPAPVPSPEQQGQQQQRRRQQTEPRAAPSAKPAAAPPPPPPPPRNAVVPGVSFKSLVSGVPDEAPAGAGKKAKAKPAKDGIEGETLGAEPGKKGGKKTKATKQQAEGVLAASMAQQQQPSAAGEAGKIRRQQRQERQLVQTQDAAGGHRAPRAENGKGRRVKGQGTGCAATEQQQEAAKEQQQQQQEQPSANPTVVMEAAHVPSAAEETASASVEHFASPDEAARAIAEPAAKPAATAAPMFGWSSQLADVQLGPAPAPPPLTEQGPDEGVAALQLPPTLDHELAEPEGGSAGGLRDVITALPADLNLDIAGPLPPAPPPATATAPASFGLPPPRTAASPPPFPGGLFPMPAGSTWQPQAPPQEAMALFYGAQPLQDGQQLLAFSASGAGMPFGPVAAAFGQGELAVGFLPTTRQPDWGAFLGTPASQPQLFGSIAPAGVFAPSVDAPPPPPPGLTASPGAHLESLLPDNVFGDAQAPEQREMRIEQQQRHEPGMRGYRGHGRRGRGPSGQQGARGPPPPPGLEMHGPGGDSGSRGGRGQRSGGGRQRRGPKPPGLSPGI